MSGCDSRKKKRELNKEEIRQCIEVFGDIINKRYASNQMPRGNHFTLTWGNHSRARDNYRKRWFLALPKSRPGFTENKVINIKIETVSNTE
jgi:hypothetical protein